MIFGADVPIASRTMARVVPMAPSPRKELKTKRVNPTGTLSKTVEEVQACKAGRRAGMAYCRRGRV
jgi:hypothetical protein